jgi:glycosyltransferase involved in cell wall biosynthesis
MRILVVSNLYPPDTLGGYEIGCSQMVGELQRRGHIVRVVSGTPRTPVPPQREVIRILKLVDIWNPTAWFGGSPILHATRQLEAGGISGHNVYQWLNQLQEFAPDVVYFWNLLGLGGLGLVAATQHQGIPWRWHLMDAVPTQLCRWRDRVPPEFGRTFARLLQGRFLCCSHTTVAEIEASGIPIAPVTDLIPNWIVTNGAPERTEWLRDGQLRIAFAGAVSEHKGVFILIEAAALARQRGVSQFHLDLYGPCVDPRIGQRIAELQLHDQVRLHGSIPQSELWQRYQQADLFAFPTAAREPFAFAPLEAMAQGCVAILPRLCGNSEWHLDGVECVKVPRTAEGYADAFVRAANGSLPLPTLGRTAIRTMLRDFRLPNVAPRVERSLQQASAERRPAAGNMDQTFRLALAVERTLLGAWMEAANLPGVSL